MRNTKRRKTVALLLSTAAVLLMLASVPAGAQAQINLTEETEPETELPPGSVDQLWVFGLTLSGVSSPFDKHRVFARLGEYESDYQQMWTLFLEGYVHQQLGFSIRNYYNEFHSHYYNTDFFFTEDYHTRAETRNLFLAVQALPIVSASGYSRMGLVLGVGRTAYQLARKDYASPEVTRANTSGPALLLESYIDWGGEDFGARIAYSEIRSRLNKTAVDTFTRTPDASAHMVQLMLRWAFE